MEMSKIKLPDDSEVVRVNGRIKNYRAFLEFKQELEIYLEFFNPPENKELSDVDKKYVTRGDAFRIYFVNSYPITDYVLGLLSKLRINDEMNIEIMVDSLRLFLFFEDFGFVDLFHIRIKEDS